LLDADARPLPAWNNAVASVADKSGTGNVLAAYRVSGSTLPPHDSPHFPFAQVLRRFVPIPYQIGEL
jgi:hypothetical protein